MYDYGKPTGGKEPPDERIMGGKPVPLLLVTFRVDLIDQQARGYSEWRSEDRGDGDRLSPEKFVVQSSARWEDEILQEVQDRLQFTRYGRFITPVIQTYPGSIFTTLTFLLVGGVSVVQFLNNYKDFYESANLFVEHSRRIVNKAILHLLQAEGGAYQNVDVIVRVDDFDTFQAQSQAQSGSPFYSPPPSDPSPPQTAGPRYRIQLSGNALFRRIGLGLVILALLVAILSQFSGPRMVLGELIGVPDLKHQVIYVGDQPGNLNQAYLVVTNQGLALAENVWIQADILGVTVNGQRTFSQVAYRAEKEDLQVGNFKYEVAKLVPGASFTIYLRTENNLSDQNTIFSVVSDRGASRQLPSRVISEPGELPGIPDPNFITGVIQFLENQPDRNLWIQLLGMKTWGVLTNEFFWYAALLAFLISAIMEFIFDIEAGVATMGLCLVLITIFFFPGVSVAGWLFALLVIVSIAFYIEIAIMSGRKFFQYLESLNILNQSLFISIFYILFAVLLLLILIVLWKLRIPLVFVVAYSLVAFLPYLLVFSRKSRRTGNFL